MVITLLNSLGIAAFWLRCLERSGVIDYLAGFGAEAHGNDLAGVLPLLQPHSLLDCDLFSQSRQRC